MQNEVFTVFLIEAPEKQITAFSFVYRALENELQMEKEDLRRMVNRATSSTLDCEVDSDRYKRNKI